MIKLETYLANHHIDLTDSQLRFKIHKWLETIKPEINIYRQFIVQPMSLDARLHQLKTKYELWFSENELVKILHEEVNLYFSSIYQLTYVRKVLIDKIQSVVDFHLSRLAQHAIWVTSEFPLNPSVNPFLSDEGGVEMAVYLIKDKDSKALQIGQFGESDVGHESQVKRTKVAGIFSNLHQAVESKAYTHAEYKWFKAFLNELIAKLETLNHQKPLQKTPQEQAYHDKNVFHHLDSYPRLEFVLSSSNCCDCKTLFAALRRILMDKGIDIPMIIFANKPFNTIQINQSPLCLIDYQAKFIETGIFIAMGYNNHQSRHGNQAQFNLDKMKAIESELTLERQLIRQFFRVMDSPKKQLLGGLVHMVCDKNKLNLHDLYWLDQWIDKLPKDFFPRFTEESKEIKHYIHERLKPKPQKTIKKKNTKKELYELNSNTGEVVSMVKNPARLGLFCLPCQTNDVQQMVDKFEHSWMVQSRNSDSLFFVIYFLMCTYLKVSMDIKALKENLGFK